jgi:alanyl-tRNA synthetase
MEKKCYTCKKLLSIDFFYNNKLSKDGKLHDCKECRKQKSKSQKKYYPRQNLSEINRRGNFLQLKGTTKEDHEMMYELCESMGYDPKNDSKTIHEQFIEKWNIILTKPLRFKRRDHRSLTQYFYDGSINPKYKN